MSPLILLGLGVAGVYLLTRRQSKENRLEEIEGAADAVRGVLPGTGRPIGGGNESTTQEPQPFSVGSGFGYTPPPTMHDVLGGSVSTPPFMSAPTTPLATTLSQGKEAVRSANLSPYAGAFSGRVGNTLPTMPSGGTSDPTVRQGTLASRTTTSK